MNFCRNNNNKDNKTRNLFLPPIKLMREFFSTEYAHFYKKNNKFILTTTVKVRTNITIK